jgi:hypothetical protein
MLRRSVLLAGGALIGLLAAGCNGQVSVTGTANDNSVANSLPSTTTMQLSGPNTGTQTTPQQANPATVGSNSAGTGKPGTPVECTAAGLKLSFGRTGVAAGSAYTPLQFTNTGRSACVLVGFPGVSFVAGNDGHQVGDPAKRVGGIGAQLTLQPGQLASAMIQVGNSGNYDPGTCKPTQALGYRVYAPDDRAAMFISFGTEISACTGTNLSSPQLLVNTMVAGAGDQS